MADFVAGGVFLVLLVVAMLSLRGKPDAKHGWWSYLAVSACAGWILLALFSRPWGPHFAAKKSVCLLHIKQLSFGLIMYQGDHDDRLPHQSWLTSATPYIRNDQMRCPSADGEWGYGMNRNLLAKASSEFDGARTMLLAECSEKGPDAFVQNESELKGRHAGTINVSALDGSGLNIHPARARELYWNSTHRVRFAAIPMRNSDTDAHALWLKEVRGAQNYVVVLVCLISLACCVRGMFCAASHRRGFWRETLAILFVCASLFLFAPVF